MTDDDYDERSTPRLSIPPGTRFGRWTVLEEAEPDQDSRGWPRRRFCVRCDCGQERVALMRSLRSGATRSCGCLRRERITRHGRRRTPEYTAWAKMRDRCMNPSSQHFADYGGRGITVCPEWTSFEAFYADMGPRPSAAHSLDRIDNDLGYSPGNCRWSTIDQQNRNRRANRLLTHNGETLCLADWAKRVGIPKSTLSRRLKLGWTTGRALEKP